MLWPIHCTGVMLWPIHCKRLLIITTTTLIFDDWPVFFNYHKLGQVFKTSPKKFYGTCWSVNIFVQCRSTDGRRIYFTYM